MNEIVFRPLRRVKKTGKVVVAGYMQWRKVKTADYNELKLIVDNECANMPSDEFVYDHEGKQLFFYPYCPQLTDYFGLENMDVEISRPHFQSMVWYPDGTGHILTNGTPTFYTGRGVDCDGVPTFSHYTADYIAIHARVDYDLMVFGPLTVGMVRSWLTWFIYKLNTSFVQIGK